MTRSSEDQYADHHELAVAMRRPVVDRFLTAGILVLFVAHALGQFSEHVLDHPNLKGLVPRFNMNGELSFSTWYATVLLIACAGVLGLIALHASRTADPSTWAWVGLTLLFTYFALDEGVAIHELTIVPLRDALGIGEGWLFFAWVIPAAIAIVAIGLVYRSFVYSLPAPTRRGLLLGAGLFVGGGIGVETVSGWYLSTQGDDYGYEMIGGLEEVLELKGVVIMLGTFLGHIGRAIGNIRFIVSPL